MISDSDQLTGDKKKSSFRKGEEKSNSLAYLTIVVSVVIPLCLRGHHCHQYNKGNRQP